MDNIEELNPFSIIYPTAKLRHWQELKESWIFRARRLSILHANCLADEACMAKRKRETFINTYNYQQGAALQNLCPRITGTHDAWRTQTWPTCLFIISIETAGAQGLQCYRYRSINLAQTYNWGALREHGWDKCWSLQSSFDISTVVE